MGAVNHRDDAAPAGLGAQFPSRQNEPGRRQDVAEEEQSCAGAHRRDGGFDDLARLGSHRRQGERPNRQPQTLGRPLPAPVHGLVLVVSQQNLARGF